jgi:serine/threonine-protein kinase
MDANRWARIRSLFHAVLGQAPRERRAFLETQCSGDERLLEDVASLLEAHEAEGTFLEEPLIRLGERWETGQRIGIFELRERLGQGGMGTVYRAVRVDGEYDTEVALKLMHAGLDGDALVARFRQERQILANLQHPNIARLLDGGTTDDGRPFLVMDAVEGAPINHYCDAHNLALPERLRLFQKVCRAVHFAHQNLVVHRDLKPANILVTAEGEPKLLDFGIAKLLEPASPGGLTRVEDQGGGVPMTPENAAPEQMGTDPITTAADIYSLGVLLFQLLTGRRPFHLEELGTEAFIHAVCHQDPPAPSTCLQEAAAATVRGDLDAIVTKALRKEPTRRYLSAEQLADDVEHFLTGRPVLAREGTLAYHAGKFLRRHRWPVAVAVAALLLLTTFIAALLVQRERILEEQAQSREVTRLLEGLFEISDPDRARGERITARELLDRGALDIRDRLTAQPELKASLLGTMGRVYRKLGLYPEAEPLLTEAHTLWLQSYGDRDHPKVVESVLDLAEQRIVTGQYREAEDLFTRAQESLPGGESQVRAVAGRADALRLQGRYGEAEVLQRQALATVREDLGAEHPLIARIANQLGNLLREMGDHESAGAAYREALDFHLQHHGPQHPAVAEVYNNLGLLAHEQGAFDEAREAFEAALAIQSKVLDAGHRDMASPHHNLAAVLHELGQYEEAEAACRTALRIRRAALGEQHPNLADSLNLLGLIRFRRGELDEAANLLEEARALWTGLLGPDFVKVAAAHNNLGQVFQARGSMEAAGEAFREALRIYTKAYGPDHTQVAVVLNNLGLLSKMQGDTESALDYYHRGLETTRQLLGAQHPKVGILSHNLAVLLQQEGDFVTAEALYRQALAAFAASLDPGHPNLGVVRKNLAGTLLSQDKVEEAAAVLEEALALFAAAGVAESEVAVLASRGLLGECRLRQGRAAEAETLLTTAHALALAQYGAEHAVTLRARERLAMLGVAQE